MKSRPAASMLLSLALLSPASAQTRIGQVTLTPSAPAPSARPEYSWEAVPAGMYELRGRIGTGREGLRLPAGSQIRVTVEEVGAPGSVASAAFSTGRLSTPYQLYFSAGRLSPGRRYVLRCRIVGASGTLLYRSADIALPRQTRSTLNITVSAP